jgi:hypothetical protein
MPASKPGIAERIRVRGRKKPSRVSGWLVGAAASPLGIEQPDYLVVRAVLPAEI